MMRAFVAAVVLRFAENVDQALLALGPNPRYGLDENGFIHASTFVYDGVREIRRAVQENRTYHVC